MGNFISNAAKRVRTWADKTIGRPATDLIKGTKRAVGLEATPIPEEAKLQLDPGKVSALSQYGSQVTERARTTQDPGAFQAQTFTPQAVKNTQLPATRMNETAINYQPTTTQAPRMAQSANTLAGYSQRQATPTEAGTAPVMQNVAGMNPNFQADTSRLQLSREAGRAAPVRQTEDRPGPDMGRQESSISPTARSNEGGQNLTLTREAGNVLNLGRPGEIGVNTDPYKQASLQALQERQQPLSLQEGFDPAMREKAVALATSGIDNQKNAALAQLKEQQMAAGNFGSSVAQKQMADLTAEYDRQKANASNQIDLQQMQAAREDRYKNSSEQSNRLGQLASLAGTGQGLEVQGAQFGREGIQQDAGMKTQEAQFARSGRESDRSSTMAEAQFGREGRGMDTNAQQIQDQFQREGRTIDKNTAMQLAQYQREGRSTDFNAAMQTADFERGGRGMDQNAVTQEAGFQRAGTQEQNRLEQIRADAARQGVQLDNNTAMQLAGYNREGRNTDFSRNTSEDQRMFGNRMTAEQMAQQGGQQDFSNQQALESGNLNRQLQAEGFNREGRAAMTQDEWNRMSEEQRRAENEASTANQASQFNIGGKQQEYQTNYGRFRDASGDLAGYAGSDQITPESRLKSEQYAQQEADRTARLGAVTNTALTAASVYSGMPRTGAKTTTAQAPSATTTPAATSLALRGTGPTSQRFMANVAADQQPAERKIGRRTRR
jgi:hypothetical protein